MKKILFISLILLVTGCVFSEEIKLTQNEVDGLLLMREEEKLARDVYTAFYSSYGQNIFNNISKSEVTHMSRVLDLLNQFGIADPIDVDVPGEFEDSELQEIYDSFIEAGSKSLYDALYIGTTIEDLDIFDLENLIKETTNSDIITTYTNLRDGSLNHMKAFHRQLVQYGPEYKAQYITEEYLQEILK